jgi:hypothetical protein
VRLLKKRFGKNSRAFWRAPSLFNQIGFGRFLRYTVETTLAGDGETLKEYLIGTEVYASLPSQCGLHCSQRGSQAPQQIKGILRASEKERLSLYLYRPGSYVPLFRRRDNQEGGGLATDLALRELLTEGLVAKALEVPSVS